MTSTCCCPGRSTTHILTTELYRKTESKRGEVEKERVTKKNSQERKGSKKREKLKR